MKNKLDPETLLQAEGHGNCKEFRPYADKCRNCALHGSYKFCKDFVPTKAQKPQGGLF